MSTFVAGTLEFLHEKRTHAASPEWLLDVQVDVAERAVVVKEHSPARGHAAIDLDDASPLALFDVGIGRL